MRNMDSSILKYSLLNSFEKKEVRDFIDFLFSKKKNIADSPSSDYRNKILSVSIWNEEDLKVFEEHKNDFDQLAPAKW